MTLRELVDQQEFSAEGLELFHCLTQDSPTSENGLIILSAAALLIARQGGTDGGMAQLSGQLLELSFDMRARAALQQRPRPALVHSRT